MPATFPEGFVVRPATGDDFEAVLQLVSERNKADYGEPMTSAAVLRALWESDALDLSRDTWLVLPPGGGVAGYAHLQRLEQDWFFVSVFEAAGYQGGGIYAPLLQLAETRGRSLAVDIPRVTFTGRVSDLNSSGRRAFESAGYTLRLSFLVMEIIMAQPPPAASWAQGITVRGFVSGQDEHATYLADEEASQDKGYHSPMTYAAWAERMNLDRPGFDPSLWFLACSGDEIVGVALNACSQETDTGWVDHLGVRRGWRNRGLGAALLLHSFGAFYRRGIQRVRLSVDSQSLTNAPRLYTRAGMRTVQQYHIYRKELDTSSQEELGFLPSSSPLPGPLPEPLPGPRPSRSHSSRSHSSRSPLLGPRPSRSHSHSTTHKGWHSRGYLPHFDAPDTIQFITFRLHDSVPAEVIQQWKQELHWSEATPADSLGPRPSRSPSSRSHSSRSHSSRSHIAAYEDTGKGACYLRDERIARVVQDALLHSDGERYRLIAWCIMPNHVHVLIEVMEHSLSNIVHSWKSFTAHKANELLGRSGRFWMPDYFDRFIRDEKHFAATVEYIRHNPVEAGLVGTPEQWLWSGWPGRVPAEGAADGQGGPGQ